MSSKTWVGIIVLVVAGAFIFKSQGHRFIKTGGSTNKIIEAWENDLKYCADYGLLSKKWNNIKRVEFYPLSDTTKDLIKYYRPTIPKNPIGLMKLEVTMDDWTDAEGHFISLTYNLVDMNSNNTVWELGRTLQIN